MQLMTRRNGGETPLQEVADAWKREDHNFGWSEYETDAGPLNMPRRYSEKKKRGC